ncbi:hypothetical protein RN607_05715 [Demequina capsici]|uniref:Uncharacterized protein n=1 Tax=Demequina capsici TaxID=3075620 RepID=A0AA96JBJ5_9MICO|nr:hypothetical protein [Demequina sp. PMTSA13]WNM28500.1 hypothetical protein RN607_05715 [Demequina sp. PMTSA13]
MRTTTTATTIALMASASLMLAACSSDTTAGDGTGDSASTAADAVTGGAATSGAATTSSAVNVSELLDSVRVASGCDSWIGGKVAGEGIVAGWEYTCDADDDGEWNDLLAIYSSNANRDMDVANYEAAYPDAAVLTGDGFVFLTTDQAQVDAVGALGAVVRELGA